MKSGDEIWVKAKLGFRYGLISESEIWLNEDKHCVTVKNSDIKMRNKRNKRKTNIL